MNRQSLAKSLKRAASARRRRVPAKTIRLRDKEHCKFVRTEPCVVCGRAPTEAHHIRFAQPRALGRKVSDEYAVRVCWLIVALANKMARIAWALMARGETYRAPAMAK
jgi:hypothetical protein